MRRVVAQSVQSFVADPTYGDDVTVVFVAEAFVRGVVQVVGQHPWHVADDAAGRRSCGGAAFEPFSAALPGRGVDVGGVAGAERGPAGCSSGPGIQRSHARTVLLRRFRPILPPNEPSMTKLDAVEPALPDRRPRVLRVSVATGRSSPR